MTADRTYLDHWSFDPSSPLARTPHRHRSRYNIVAKRALPLFPQTFPRPHVCFNTLGTKA